MTPEHRVLLLSYAHQCVEAAVREVDLPDLDSPPSPIAAAGAAFVTLRNGSDLRGCIGQIEARSPLWQAVRDMSAAATRDPRFDPVRPDERVQIEISVLSPFFQIRPDEIRIGVHGLHVRLGRCSGLLLPQVALEWGWDAPTFLERTCRKAGLPGDGWREAELRAFTAERFGDSN